MLGGAEMEDGPAKKPNDGTVAPRPRPLVVDDGIMKGTEASAAVGGRPAEAQPAASVQRTVPGLANSFPSLPWWEG